MFGLDYLEVALLVVIAVGMIMAALLIAGVYFGAWVFTRGYEKGEKERLEMEKKEWKPPGGS